MTGWEEILKKALVTSGLDTKGWMEIETALRNRAFFSAEVMQMRIVHDFRTNVAEIMKNAKSNSEVRRDIREILASIGYDSGENRGTIKDLMTKARLDVMIRTNIQQARGYANHLKATSAGAIMAFPAYEFVRVQQRKVPRNWGSRWTKAANTVGWEGVAKDTSRMIALKYSPIWKELSVFGNPFPPFDFNSGMGVRDVSKSVCREIGLLGPGEQPKIPEKPDFNGNLEAAVNFDDNSPEWAHLKKVFGDQIVYKDGKVKWAA